MSKFTPEQLREKGYHEGPGGTWHLADVGPPQNRAQSCEVAPPPKPTYPAIRVKKRTGPNSTEARYKADRSDRPEYAGMEWRYEEVSLRLPSGTLYTPDWTIWDGDRLVAVVECKGAYRLHSQARSVHAFKEAFAVWPGVRFIWAMWKNQEWHETEVVPTTQTQQDHTHSLIFN